MRRLFYVLAAIVVALTPNSVALAATVDIFLGQIEEEPVFDDRAQAEEGVVKVAVIGDPACGDVLSQAEGDRGMLLEAYWASEGNPAHNITFHYIGQEDLPDELATSMKNLLDRLAPYEQVVRAETGAGMVWFYSPRPTLEESPADNGRAGGYRAVTVCGPTVVGAHEPLHPLAGAESDKLHLRGHCVPGVERGLDTTEESCSAPLLVAKISPANMAAISAGFIRLSGTVPEPPGNWIRSQAQPGFEFQVRITAGGESVVGTPEADCIIETLCFSGNLSGRPEVFVKVIGPRPNGFLWVQVSRFTPSRVEVWVRQVSTGVVKYYDLDAVGAASDDVSGLQDREAFLP